MQTEEYFEHYHFCKLRRDVRIRMNETTEKPVEKDKKLLLSTRGIEEFKRVFGYDVFSDMEGAEEYYVKYAGQNLNNKKLFIYREGGIGDLLMISPSIRHLKEKYPDSEIYMGCVFRYADVFSANPLFDGIRVLPITKEEFESFDFHVSFQNTIESADDGRTMHGVDLYAKRFGILEELTDRDKIPSVIMRQEVATGIERQLFGGALSEEDDEKKSKFKRKRKRVGVHLTTSGPIRTFPPSGFFSIISDLLDSDPEIDIFIIDSASLEENIDNTIARHGLGETNRVVNASKLCINIQVTMAIVGLMDVVLGADSSIIHIAGGLSIPIVALYGPFPSDLRLRYYPNAIAFDANAKCSPCFLHQQTPCPYSDGASSPCFHLINTKDVVSTVLKQLNKKNV